MYQVYDKYIFSENFMLCIYLGYDVDFPNKNVCAWYILFLSF